MVDIEKIPFTHCKWFKQSSALPCQYYLDDGLCSLKWQFRCTEYLRHTEVTLSHSSLQEYTHCHLKYYLSHIMGLELIEKPWTMVQGGIAHEVLSGLHSNNPSKSNLDFNSIINIYAQKHRNPNADKPDVWPYAMRGFFEAYVELGNAKSKGLTEYYWKCGKVDNPSVIGYIDLIKPDLKHAREFKWSGSPDWYRKFTVQDQVGIYFLGVPQLESMTTRILVVPNSKEGLRLGNGEDLSGYQDRVKTDVIRRPKHYIRDMTYWRTEFNYKILEKKIVMVGTEITNYLDIGIEAFYQNTQACFNPLCQFQNICDSDMTVSEEIYKKRDVIKHEEDNGKNTITNSSDSKE